MNQMLEMVASILQNLIFNKVKFKNSSVMILQIVIIKIVFIVIINIIIYDAFITKVVKKKYIAIKILGHTFVFKFPCSLTNMLSFVDFFILYFLWPGFCISAVDFFINNVVVFFVIIFNAFI